MELMLVNMIVQDGSAMQATEASGDGNVGRL
jgi:hypothetical protein